MKRGTRMSVTVSHLFQSLPSTYSPGEMSAGVMAFCQDRAFYHLAVQKQVRRDALKAFFGGRRVERCFVGEDINRFECHLRGLEVTTISPDFFNAPDKGLRQERMESLEGALVILNNNDIARARQSGGYQEFFASCEKTIFAAWDWDNHHWLENSAFVAAHSDLYCPAHHENLYLLSRYNWLIAGPLYCASIQWSRRFLCAHLPEMLGTNRSNAPLGKHVPYGMFSFRNEVLSTLSNHYSSIGFSDQSFHGRDASDRLREWCGYKVHWIMPVLNDVGIRIFDALITGGIPIIPASMKMLPLIREIPEEYILFFEPTDVVDPKKIVEEGVARFDAGGMDKLVERHRYALENHHGDQRMDSMLAFLERHFLASIPKGC